MRLHRFYKRAIQGQRGASYSLSTILIFPVFLMFLLTVFEIGFLSVSRFGVQRAAHSAARSAAVWNGITDDSDISDRASLAAWSALAPYVGDAAREGDGAGPVPSLAVSQGEIYASTVSRNLQDNNASSVFRRKFEIAAARTAVKVEANGPLVRAEVTYRARLTWPFVSKFLTGGNGSEYPLSANVYLPVELIPGRRLGIQYSATESSPERSP